MRLFPIDRLHVVVQIGLTAEERDMVLLQGLLAETLPSPRALQSHDPCASKRPAPTDHGTRDERTDR